MFKSLFCQLFTILCCCCLYGYSTNPANLPHLNDYLGPECPLVFDIVIDVDESNSCYIPATICNESTTATGPVNGATQSVPLFVDTGVEQENGEIQYLPFGIKLDLADYQTVPLFLKVVPIEISCGNWEVHLIPVQLSWGFEVINSSDMTLGVSNYNSSGFLAEINFSPINWGEGSYMNLTVTLPQERVKFSTYTYCGEVIPCEEYEFPPYRPDEQIFDSLVSYDNNSEEAVNGTSMFRGTASASTNSFSSNATPQWKVVNPFRDVLDVRFPQSLGQPAMLTLYAIDGKQVQQIQIPPGNNHYRLPINDLPSGTYLLRVMIDNEAHSHLVVKG